MKPEDKRAIIARVEEVRKALGHNKSRFSAEIGMKPQTYNNFIGAQGSKPNVELLVGCVRRWGVQAHYLLTGEGPMFGQIPPMGAREPKRPPELEAMIAHIREAGAEQIKAMPGRLERIERGVAALLRHLCPETQRAGLNIMPDRIGGEEKESPDQGGT